MTRRLISTAAAASLLLLTGCGGGSDTTPDTQTATATTKPQQDPEQVAAQVIAYYERDPDYRNKEGLLTDDATDIAIYSYIDKRNANTRELLRGDRTREIVDVTVKDHQVEQFNDGSGSPQWTIVLNLCVNARVDYRDADGTVLRDPEKASYGPERVTARYDGPAKDWKLTDFEPGDPKTCGLTALGDGTTPTTAPAGGDETKETTAP